MIFSTATTTKVIDKDTAKASDENNDGQAVLTSLGKIRRAGMRRPTASMLHDLNPTHDVPAGEFTTAKNLVATESKATSHEGIEEEKAAWEIARNQDLHLDTQPADRKTTQEIQDLEDGSTASSPDEEMEWNSEDTVVHRNTEVSTSDAMPMAISVEKATGWTQVNRKKRVPNVYAAEETDNRVPESVQTIMRRRGETEVEKATDKDNPVQIEFKLPHASKRFNLRVALGKLMQVMQEVDKTVKVQSQDGTNSWNTAEELPVGEEMMENFVIRHDSPPYEAPKVMLHCTFKSTWTINDIKYDSRVFMHLKNNNIYVRPDRFRSEKVRSPGYFVNVAPRLIWKDCFVSELRRAVAGTSFDCTNTIIADYFNHNNIPKGTTTPPLPSFHLHVTTRKFGQVAAEVLTLTCGEKDALYMKKLLATVAEQEKMPRGQFVPTGLHLVAGPTTVINLLRNQNSYMDQLTVVAIEGIKAEAMEKELKQRLLLDNPGIISIEKTNATTEKGKWFIILKKSAEASFQDYLDTTLQTLMIEGLAEDSLTEGYDAPRRAGAQKSASVLGSYAAMLKQKTKPMNTHKPNKYDKPHTRPHKRANTNPVTTTLHNGTQRDTQRSYAAATTAHHDSYYTTETHWPDLASTLQSGGPKPKALEPASKQETLAAMETRLTNSLENKFKTQLEDRFAEMREEFRDQMETKMQNMSTQIEKNITSLIKTSLEELNTAMQSTLTSQVGQLMVDLTKRIALATTGSKRMCDNVMITPNKLRKAATGEIDGRGDQNTSSIPQILPSADATEE